MKRRTIVIIIVNQALATMADNNIFVVLYQRVDKHAVQNASSIIIIIISNTSHEHMFPVKALLTCN